MKKTIIGILGLGLVVVALTLTIFSVPDPLISRQDVLMAGDIERVKFLIAVGADINEPNTKGVTPLHVVAQEGYPALAQLLIAYGANLHTRYQNLWTPLHLAAQSGHLEVTNLLIAYGANVNGPKDTFTPLHFAAQEGHLGTARLLIAHGANVQGQYKNGWTPLHLAAQEGHTDMVTFLLDHGAFIHAKTPLALPLSTLLHSSDSSPQPYGWLKEGLPSWSRTPQVKPLTILPWLGTTTPLRSFSENTMIQRRILKRNPANAPQAQSCRIAIMIGTGTHQGSLSPTVMCGKQPNLTQRMVGR